MNDVHYSSKTVIWETPQPFFDVLNAEFGFQLDVCALLENAKCERFFSPEQDGLVQKWDGVCFCNPPYGREISKWIKKAYESSLTGSIVVCLIPSRTDTRWFHDYVLPFAEIRFIPSRLYFSGKGRAPFPSAVVIFRPRKVIE